MKHCFAIFLLLYCYKAAAQRPPLDTSAFRNWPVVNNAAISPNGQWALYMVRAHYRHPPTLVIQSLRKQWQKEFPAAADAVFTADSRKTVFLQSKDSLCIFTLSSEARKYIPEVASYRYHNNQQAEWLICRHTGPGKVLRLYNLQTAKQQTYPNVVNYLLSKSGGALVLKTPDALRWVRPETGAEEVIPESAHAEHLVLDAGKKRLAFMTRERDGKHSLRLYTAGTCQTILLANDTSGGIDSALQLGGISHFSKEGSMLFISLKEKARPTPPPRAVQADVWSYMDAKLQSQQLEELLPKSYAAVIHLDNRHIIRLQQNDETVDWTTDEQVGITYLQGDAAEAHWNSAAQHKVYIVSTSDGHRKALAADLGRFAVPSPGGKYLAGLEYAWKDLYCYEPATGMIRNITASLPAPVSDPMDREFADQPYFSQYRGLCIAAWLADEQGLLVYDDFDIWRVDPAGKKAPVNLTNGYGRRNNIVFRLSGDKYDNKTVPARGKLIVTAFDKTSKNNGFYRIRIDKPKNPRLLTMGPYLYEAPDYGLGGAPPVKARNAKIWLVKRSSSTESPNYYYTRNFRRFGALSHVYPEKRYNWLLSSLHTFAMPDGREAQGILYQPQDFDPAKQYPLLIHYYERKSHELHKYHLPAGPNGDLDIAWFVSHGYLVFTPDIYYTIGRPGQGAYNAVVGAAGYLGGFPWVDTKRMGIQGHSFGGFETNYIITHTGLFAAAVSSSGPSDLVSLYNGNLFGGRSAQPFVERSQFRMGGTLWEKPALYIENSPVFNADKVTTPLLMVANKMDHNVPFTQGVELFTALRRLGKKVWMLQYDRAYHGLRGKAYIDYVLRMTQFFDHYLKGAPAPVWMTRGIPARSKGIENGFIPDNTIKTPGPGILINTVENGQPARK